MSKHLTKLFLAGVAALALLALGITSILSPAWAAKVKTCVEGNALACIEDKLDLLLANQTRLVFLSSTTHQGDLGGVPGADAICEDLAATAGLQGPFDAWIASSGSNDPITRFIKSNKASYRLLDGTIIADNWADLTDGTIDHAIDMDEDGNTVNTDLTAWTAVDADGTWRGFEDCLGWTLPAGFGGALGRANVIDSRWTEGPGAADCSNIARVYCFER